MGWSLGLPLPGCKPGCASSARHQGTWLMDNWAGAMLHSLYLQHFHAMCSHGTPMSSHQWTRKVLIAWFHSATHLKHVWFKCYHFQGHKEHLFKSRRKPSPSYFPVFSHQWPFLRCIHVRRLINKEKKWPCKVLCCLAIGWKPGYCSQTVLIFTSLTVEQ